MKMPWSIRIVFCWFVLLAVASCLPLMFCVWTLMSSCHTFGSGEPELLLLCVLLLMAMFGSFVFAIWRGPRRWITIPYAVTGLFFLFLCFNGDRGICSCAAGIIVALATIVPLVMLHSSRATAWFDSLGQRKGLNWGLISFSMLVLCLVVLPAVVTVSPSAAISAQTQWGRQLFREQAMNRTNHESDASVPLVDPSVCSNSEEYVRNLVAANDDNNYELAQVARQWTFVVNVPEDAPDTFPVMFTANFDPSVLPREWDGGANKHIEIYPLEGAEPLRFGNKAVVVIRKSGSAQVFRKKYWRLDLLFGRQPYKFAENTYFLTPVGKIYPMLAVEGGR